ARTLGIGGHRHRLEHAFLRRRDAHADFDMTAVAMGVVCLAEARIFADRVITNFSAVNGAPPTGLRTVGLGAFLLPARDEGDSVEQTRFVRAEATLASGKQARQCQQQNISTLQISLPARAAVLVGPRIPHDRALTIGYILDHGASS